MKKIKYKNIFLLLILFICIITIIYNLITIIIWNNDQNKIIEEANNIKKEIKITEIKDGKGELINPPKDELSDYWYYANFPFTDVNIEKLKKLNNDTVGYINVSGTNINYPVVQTKNNDYYLNHSFKKKKNSAGWIFMDYRNNINFIDNNTIIYGHGRINKTMFGTLTNILNTSWVNNEDNYVIRYSTEFENLLFQIFSVYIVPVESYYIQTDFVDDKNYIIWLKTISKRSEYNFNTTINENDKIITLSTCKDDNNRVVMHAKLIKKMPK